MSLLHPEVEHLLAEIAADPNSSLLRIPRAKILPELFRPPDPIRQSAYFLTSAERHLLAVHREEVAHWLRVGLVFARSEGRRSRNAYFAEVPLDRKRWLRKQSVIAATANLEGDLHARIHVPGRWVDDEACALEVQAAAQRLVPSPLGPVVAAQLVTSLGDYSSALRLLREGQAQLEGSAFAPLLRTSAGVVYWRLGRHREAAVAYERAWTEDPSQPIYLVAAALNGALAGEVSQVVETAFARESGTTLPGQVWAAGKKQASPHFAADLHRARSSNDRVTRRVLEVFDDV